MIERIYRNDSNAARLIKAATAVAILAGGCAGDAARNSRGDDLSSTRITETFRPTNTPGETYSLILTPSPTLEPTSTPTLAPTPTQTPTPEPPAPTKLPTEKPTSKPTPRPTEAPTPPPIETPTPPTFNYDLYNSADVFWQTANACTAATLQMDLNMIASAGTGGGGFSWSATDSATTEETIYAYERAHDVTLATSPGSDPAGERNAINHYGWSDAQIYTDESYSSFAAASKAVVASIARTEKLVVIFTQDGTHAQLITGYKVTGEDPATSNNFTIVGVYLTDPLRADGYRNTFVSLANWSGGAYSLRFTRDLQIDAVYKDSDGIVGNTKWNGYWVILAPIK